MLRRLLSGLLALATSPLFAQSALDCTAVAKDCPLLEIAGDRPASLPRGRPSPFRGFADPSIRRDPATGTLWLAYSWPNVHVEGRGRTVPAVDIHLASSADSGRTWRYEGPLWPSESDTDRGGTGEPGRTSYETANLLPVETPAGVVWIGARMPYFLPLSGGFRRRPGTSFRIQILEARSPRELRSASSATLGTRVTAPGWGVDVDLTALSPELGAVGMWSEPALHSEGGTLYLALRGFVFSGRTPLPARSDLVVFATEPRGPVRQWRWRYVGRLAGNAEARELGGEGLTQIDLARGTDGELLALLTPDHWDRERQDLVHQGCRVIEVASLDPPRLARDASGKLRVRAVVTASDLAELGPGASAYDPASVTGILFVRRDKRLRSMTASIHSTGVRP